MSLITGLIVIGSAVANMITTIAASKGASDSEKAQRQYEDDLFEAQEKQKAENAKALRKQALMRAFRVDAPVVPKQVAGVRPPRENQNAKNIANIFGAIGGGLSQAAAFTDSLPVSKKAPSPNSAINYIPSQKKYENPFV